jgi:hypothetical protein
MKPNKLFLALIASCVLPACDQADDTRTHSAFATTSVSTTQDVGVVTGATSEGEVEQEIQADSKAPSSNFSALQLPHGVSVELPRNWIVLSSNSRMTVDTAAEAMSRAAGNYEASELPFAANLYDDAGKTIALFNIRYYPEMDASQADVISMNRADVDYIDAELREGLQQAAVSYGFRIVSWEGTRLVRLNGIATLITDYRREVPDKPISRVSLVRVINGKRSFTATVSYHEKKQVMLRPVVEYIIASIRQSE